MEHPKNEISLQLEKLALAINLISTDRRAGDTPVRSIIAMLGPAIAQNQIQFAFDGSGYPIGYWVWALVSEETDIRLRSSERPVLDPTEWNEGDLLWIIHFVSRPGHVRDLITYIRDNFFASRKQIYSFPSSNRKKNRTALTWRPRKNPRATESAEALFFRLAPSSYAGSYTEWLERSKPHDVDSLTR